VHPCLARASFTAYMGNPLSGAPTGKYLFIIIGPRTFRLRSFGVGNKLPPAWSANNGTPTYLTIRQPDQ